jgi:lipid II isoglutaminyl synthase (glutamine-hydrolysing)
MSQNKKNLSLTIAHLYPKSMNIYGDQGNILALQKRCQWRGIKTDLNEIEVGQNYNFSKADIVFAGGGQDQSQLRIAKDLQTRKINILKAVNSNIIFLLICGTYQLFGHYFTTHENTKIKGISILDMHTKASNQRKIGNVIINVETIHELSLPKQTLVGFENHSGNTFINEHSKTKPLGKVISGFGNNGQDSWEGARYKNVFGTYLHGSLLPKNPHFADYLIKLALERKYGKEFDLKKLDDELENKAHQFVINKRSK